MVMASLVAEPSSMVCGRVVVVPGLQSTGSVVMVHGLGVLCMWDLPGPGKNPVSSALAGGFFATEPPAKPPFVYFCLYVYCLRRLTKENIGIVYVTDCFACDLYWEFYGVMSYG